MSNIPTIIMTTITIISTTTTSSSPSSSSCSNSSSSSTFDNGVPGRTGRSFPSCPIIWTETN
eukprot:7198830-Pyramimonas_sp.AAC.1